LLHRGLKTLKLRVDHQNRAAGALAEFLEAHPRVTAVNYPGLRSDPNHERAVKYFDGFGGMLSFVIDGTSRDTQKLIESFQLASHATSLGGPETLVLCPATSTHSMVSAEVRTSQGISDTLVRVSVGLESSDDILDDFNHALACK
jgi:cystathionine beta-lyase/cystathionine gamma-synthase